MKSNVLFLFLTTLGAVLLKLLFIFLNIYVGSFFGEIMPVVNMGASILIGLALGDILLKQNGGFYKIILVMLFLICSVTVYLSTDYFNFHFWKHQVAKKAKMTDEKAQSEIDYFLKTKTGSASFVGYLKLEISKEPGEMDFEDADSFIDIIVPLLLRLFQWISSLFKIQIAGLIELIFWYLFSWIWIYIGSTIMGD